MSTNLSTNTTPDIKKLKSQNTDTILMIEPVAFIFNEQTAQNNFFQKKVNFSENEIQQKAYQEFNAMVDQLRSYGIRIQVVSDTPEPHTPDSIFPNNWISFHNDGQVVLYPMFAPNRRKERRTDILDYLKDQHCEIKNIVDFTFWEEEGLYLEGTGSMILDRIHRIAYAALSERTNLSVFLQFCKVFEFEPVYFTSNQTVNGSKLPVYHTNVMMSIADDFAVVCLDSIENREEKSNVIAHLQQTGKEIIPITEKQMCNFAGNVLQVRNTAGKLYLVISETAFNSLDQHQTERLKNYNDLIVVSIPTIETIGGGSVRCMMAEIFY